MSKIIIKNQTEMDDISVLTLVQRVIKNGRISNNGKQYCYLTSFEIEEAWIENNKYNDEDVTFIHWYNKHFYIIQTN
jgi:hypothetical protein